MNRVYVPLFFVLFSHLSCTFESKIDHLSNILYKNPIFLDHEPSILGQVNINHHEFDEIKKLELLDRVMQVLRAYQQFDKCDRLSMIWFCSVLKDAESEDEAIKEWRNVAVKHNKCNRDLTATQMRLINLPESYIKNFYKLAQDSIKNVEPELTQALLIRVLKHHQWHDKHQTNAIPLRSFAIVKNRKINISLLKNCINIVKELYEESPNIPIYERLKNLKVFHINDFYASKGSLIIHDIFDHFWFASKLEESGIFYRYRKFWKRLGCPQIYDLFSREGELYASIAFDFRSFQLIEDNYSPLFNIDDVRRLLKDASSSNQKRALEIVNTTNNSEFLKGLSYIISGMAIELAESNRKAGFIKTLDKQFKPNGYFDFFDPEHIAFIVEAVDLLFKHKDEYLQLLSNMVLRVEKYLSEIALNKDVTRLVIGLDDLNNLVTEDFSIIPSKRVEWIRKNKGFESIRYPIQ